MQSLAGKEAEFDLYGKKIFLRDGRLSDKNGTLAGAHLAMDQAVRNMIEFAGVSEVDAIDMASANPASALKLEDQLGKVQKGFRASFTFLDSCLHSEGVMIDGQAFPMNRSIKQYSKTQ